MKKKPAIKKTTAPAKTRPDDLAPLIAEVRSLIQSARRNAASVVNTLQVMTNFEIGRRIVEHEQGGAERAEYGKALLKGLAASLTAEFGRGFSKRNLEYMRKFYLAYQDRLIAQMPSAQLPAADNSQMPSGKLAPPQKSQTASGELADTGRLPQIWQTASAQFISPFKLSWSQYGAGPKKLDNVISSESVLKERS